jgi:alkanesulfonate monooxygenase SsuD/methylene tetrahydromethanopterin reductase-like flavin-dependent oxidoreductase (luciferase family)
VGWLAEEFQALGVPFEHRGSRCRDYIAVLKTLWCDDVSQFDGDYYTLPPTRQFPKPVQQPHPPIHFGGESDAALRRVADLGAGWYGFGLSPEALANRLQRLDVLLERCGRTRGEVEISVCPYMLPATLETIQGYRDAGVDRVILTAAAADQAALLATLDRLTTFVEAE